MPCAHTQQSSKPSLIEALDDSGQTRQKEQALATHAEYFEYVESGMFVDTLRKMALESSFEKRKAIQATWNDIHKVITDANRWKQPNKDGVLAWQSLITLRPALLPAVLKTPPPTGLNDTSPSGGGLWDCVLDGLCDSKSASTTALNGLLRKLPLKRVVATPLLWRWWSIKVSPHTSFLQATGDTHPDVWLGSKEEQRNGAVELLASLCNSDVHSQSMRKVRALLDPCLTLDGADDELKLSAKIIQEVVDGTPELLRQFETVNEKSIETPLQVGNDFLSRLTDAIAEEKSGHGDYEDDIAQLILSCAQRHALSIETMPNAEVTASRHRRRI